MIINLRVEVRLIDLYLCVVTAWYNHWRRPRIGSLVKDQMSASSQATRASRPTRSLTTLSNRRNGNLLQPDRTLSLLTPRSHIETDCTRLEIAHESPIFFAGASFRSFSSASRTSDGRRSRRTGNLRAPLNEGIVAQVRTPNQFLDVCKGPALVFKWL